MLISDQINELHRLYVSERWPIRKIERHLNMGWRTIKKYLETSPQGAATREGVPSIPSSDTALVRLVLTLLAANIFDEFLAA